MENKNSISLDCTHELRGWVLGHKVRVEDAVGASPEILQQPPFVATDLLRLAQRLQLVFPAEQIQPIGSSRPHGVLGKQPVLLDLGKRWCEPVWLDIVTESRNLVLQQWP